MAGNFKEENFHDFRATHESLLYKIFMHAISTYMIGLAFYKSFVYEIHVLPPTHLLPRKFPHNMVLNTTRYIPRAVNDHTCTSKRTNYCPNCTHNGYYSNIMLWMQLFFNSSKLLFRIQSTTTVTSRTSQRRGTIAGILH